jgi:hypothetical protein
MNELLKRFEAQLAKVTMTRDELLDLVLSIARRYRVSKSRTVDDAAPGLSAE